MWIMAAVGIGIKIKQDNDVVSPQTTYTMVHPIVRTDNAAMLQDTREAMEIEDMEVLENIIVQLPEKGCLTASLGTFRGPSGKETWYNLPMDGVIEIMRNMGYSKEEYPYWIREDGCKMLGDFIMVAASHEIRPRGTVLQTSLGMALVCDTGGFVKHDQTQIDIATNW